MKKVIITLMIFGLLISMSLTGLSAAETIELTLADTTSSIGLRGEGVNIFVEEIEKHTNGQVKINVYWGGSLLKGKEILNGIATGIVDMGYIAANYYPKQLLLHSAVQLIPVGPTSAVNNAWVYSEIRKIDALKKEMDAQNQKVIYATVALPSAIASSKPLTGFDDLKGLRIRASSRWILAELKDVGAVPVSVPWADCYMALQTGTIDGVYTSLDGIHRTKLDEVAPHILASKELWDASFNFYTININKWNSLSKEIQDGILAGSQAAEERFAEMYEKEWEKIISEQRELGYTVTLTSKEDIEKWTNLPIIPKLQAQWIKEAEEAGAENPAQVMKDIQAIVQEGIAKDK